MNVAQQRSGERDRTFAIIAHHQSKGPLFDRAFGVCWFLNPESEKFADSDGRLIASGLWQQQRLRKLNYRQGKPVKVDLLVMQQGTESLFARLSCG
ncbi:hypothetical protein [Klebsiella quasipneumoniae]|uniref:hypothetical protein n=1 Tax=Klebsiella quasipneumoniae TaxID=1463165 RepID=UPI003890C9B8